MTMICRQGVGKGVLPPCSNAPHLEWCGAGSWIMADAPSDAPMLQRLEHVDYVHLFDDPRCSNPLAEREQNPLSGVGSVTKWEHVDFAHFSPSGAVAWFGQSPPRRISADRVWMVAPLAGVSFRDILSIRLPSPVQSLARLRPGKIPGGEAGDRHALPQGWHHAARAAFPVGGQSSGQSPDQPQRQRRAICSIGYFTKPAPIRVHARAGPGMAE